jgi:MFS family permease
MNPSPKSLLLLAWIAGFTLIDSSIVSLALPEIARELDRSIAELAWVSTGFLLALAASLLGAGRLCDRFGSRRVMIGGAAGFLATTAACGLAPVFELLLAARVLQGMAGGVLYTVSLAIAATAYPPERRAGALSIYFTSGALGAVLGPVAGGLLPLGARLLRETVGLLVPLGLHLLLLPLALALLVARELAQRLLGDTLQLLTHAVCGTHVRLLSSATAHPS